MYHSHLTIMFSLRLSMWNPVQACSGPWVLEKNVLLQEYWFSVDINSWFVSWASTISMIPEFSWQVSGSLFKQQVLSPHHPSLRSWPLPFDFLFRWQWNQWTVPIDLCKRAKLGRKHCAQFWQVHSIRLGTIGNQKKLAIWESGLCLNLTD